MMGLNGVDPKLICYEFVVTIVWVVQFALVIAYRFSHTGKVCGGDFAQMLFSYKKTDDKTIKEDALKDARMAPYYMLEEGDFLYYYIASVGVLAVIEGDALISISQGFRLSSKRTSKPYSSKQCLSFMITLATD